MKTLTVNVQIQFDTFEKGGSAMEHTYNVIDKMNEVLRREFPDISPQMLVGALDKSDISPNALSKEELIQEIKDIIKETGTFTMRDLNEQTDNNSEHLVLHSTRNGSTLIDSFSHNSIGITEYVHETEVDTDHISYEELTEEMLQDIYDYVELYRHLTL